MPISALALQNVKLVFAFHRAYNRGDLDRAFACFHEEVEVRGYNGFVSRGREASARSALAWLEQWACFTSEPRQVTGLDEDRVLVICHNIGTGKRSGVEIEMFAGEIWGFRDGKISSVTVFRDCEEALEAAETWFRRSGDSPGPGSPQARSGSARPADCV